MSFCLEHHKIINHRNKSHIDLKQLRAWSNGGSSACCLVRGLNQASGSKFVQNMIQLVHDKVVVQRNSGHIREPVWGINKADAS